MPKEGFAEILCKNIVWSIVALIFGVIINSFMSKLPISNSYILIITQITILSIVITINADNYFGWSLQNTYSGLFFVAIFFGVQTVMFDNVKKITG